MNSRDLERGLTRNDYPPRVTLTQWVLAFVSGLVGAAAYSVADYGVLAVFVFVLSALSFALVIAVAKETLRTRLIGKFCLVAGTLVFYWIDALSLAVLKNPFSVPDGFPMEAEQFDIALIQQALVYVAIFQFCLLVGYSLRPRLQKLVRFFNSRVDGGSFDRRIVGYLLIACSLLPLLIYYDFNFEAIVAVLIAGRNSVELDTPEPGLAQHLTLFGICGSALFFVYALKAQTWRKVWMLLLGVLSALPFIMSGTRHIWLYISLPSVLILLRGFKGQLDRYRILGLTAAVLFVLVVAQVQFAYRSVGWTDVGTVPAEGLSQLNTNGQLTALLFAQHLVPGEHSYFMEPAEPYFLIHWIPRQFWPTKPIMESWTYFNDSYVQGAAFNVTPSVVGQFHMSWGLPGVIFIGIWLGFLTSVADRVLILLDSDRQRAMFVAVGMFYAFIISSFRFYSPIYFSYFLFGFLAMLMLTRRIRFSSALARMAPPLAEGVRPLTVSGDR